MVRCDAITVQKLPVEANLELGPEGYWRSNRAQDISYPSEGNDLCFAVEDGSFWFQHRNRCIVETVRRNPPAGAIFDIGGGNGCVSRALLDAGFDSVVVEPGPSGARNAVARGVPNVICSTLEDAGFPPQSIAAVGLFDVIEHIADDAGFLASLNRYLLPGGKIYLTVPAYQSLWSQEDVLAGHCRRYSLQQLLDVVRSAGFEVNYCSGIFRFLIAPIFLARVLPYRLGWRRQLRPENVKADHQPANGLGAALLKRLCASEVAKIQSGRSQQTGATWLLTATLCK